MMMFFSSKTKKVPWSKVTFEKDEKFAAASSPESDAAWGEMMPVSLLCFPRHGMALWFVVVEGQADTDCNIYIRHSQVMVLWSLMILANYTSSRNRVRILDMAKSTIYPCGISCIA